MLYRHLLFTAAATLAAAATGCGQHAQFASSSSRSERATTPSASADATGLNGPSTAAPNAANGESSFPPGEEPTTGDLPGSDGPAPPPDFPGSDPTTPPAPAPPDFPGTDPNQNTQSMTFPTSQEVPSQVTETLADATLSQNFTLYTSTTAKTVNATQTAQPPIEDDFTQGVGEAPITDTFYGATDRPLDVLLVLDDGCNMNGLEQDYAAKLAPLLDSVAQTDWQIAVTTTDPSEACVRAVVKKNDTNAASELASAVAVGLNGSDNPRGVLTAVASLADTCQPSPWIRPNSQLEVVFVSNEDNCVDGTQCPGKSYAQASYLTDYLATIRTVGKTARVHGVFMPNVQACTCQLGLDVGNTYQSLVNSTGGAFGSICNEDYQPVIDAIGAGASNPIRSNFTLSTTPAAGTLTVAIDGVAQTTGFTLTGNVLSLSTPLADGHQLTATYGATVTTPQTVFALRFPPLAGTVSVSVNGTTADPSTYTVNATAPSVTFTTAPASGATIAVNYTRNVPLLTQFTLPSTPVADFVTTTVNGTATTAFTFDPTTDVVTFASAPPASAAIVFSYTVAGSPVLSYPLALGATAPAGLTLADANTGAAVAFNYANGLITIGASDFQNGRILVATWSNAARDSLTVTLPNTPTAGSVEVTSGGASCLASDFTVTGSTVSIANCPFPATATDVVISYTYTTFNTVFTFSNANPPASAAPFWSVFVNGVETKAYTQSGNVFTFPAPLPAGETVLIELTTTSNT